MCQTIACRPFVLYYIQTKLKLKKKEKKESFVFWDLSNLGNCFSPDILPSRLAIVSPTTSTLMKVKIMQISPKHNIVKLKYKHHEHRTQRSNPIPSNQVFYALICSIIFKTLTIFFLSQYRIYIIFLWTTQSRVVRRYCYIICLRMCLTCLPTYALHQPSSQYRKSDLSSCTVSLASAGISYIPYML